MRCERCFRRCEFSEKRLGTCQAVSFDGKDLRLDPPHLSTVSIGPVEEKAIYHFWPGSRVLTVGFHNCNLRCSFCINHEISHQRGEENLASSESLIEMALKENAQGIAFSFSEPLLYAEFVDETFKAAHKRGLYTALKTSAMVSSDLFRMVLMDTDACSVDVKGDAESYRSNCDVAPKDLEQLYENLEMARNYTNLEVSTIVRSKDSRLHSMLTDLSWVVGPLTPLHLISFIPSFKRASDSPATLEDVTMARGTASIYFEYVYDESPSSETVCRGCYKTIVTRNGDVVTYDLPKGNACACGRALWKNPCDMTSNAQNAGRSLR